jgi:hypothetical protein
MRKWSSMENKRCNKENKRCFRRRQGLRQMRAVRFERKTPDFGVENKKIEKKATV